MLTISKGVTSFQSWAVVAQSVRLVTRGCGFESRLRQELCVCVHLDGLNAENTFHC